MFTKREFLEKNPTVLLEHFEKNINMLFSKIGINYKPNIVIATVQSFFSSSSGVHNVNEIEITDAQGTNTKITISEILPSKRNKLEEGELIKEIVLRNLSTHDSEEAYSYYTYEYMDEEKRPRKSDGQRYIHRLALIECNNDILSSYGDECLFQIVMGSISDYYFSEKTNQADEYLNLSGRKLVDLRLLSIVSKPEEQSESLSIYYTINNLSLIKYEGSENKGKILFCREIENLPNAILLQEGIELANYRAVRKLLEISNGNLYLISDGFKVYGFIEGNSLTGLTKYFIVTFNGLGQWEVEQPIGKRIMSVSYGVPSLPKTPISEEYFARKFEKVFDMKTYNDVWKLIDNARNQHHGTMVVVTDDAPQEVKRLWKQSFPLKTSSEISHTNIKDLTSIDGALLVDTSGVCYAIGLILDGLTEANLGDMSRGARYNSALKYLNASKGKRKCLIVIISEDGMIDIKTEEDVI